MTLIARKRELRRAVSASIRAVDAAARAVADRRICSMLLAMPEFSRSTQVLTYWPLSDEVDVSSFNLAAFRAGKAIYLPTLQAADALEYRRWAPGDVLEIGRYGVREPTNTDTPSEGCAVVLVPGRAFSIDGLRLGRGGGYYDRALPALARFGTTIGVAYGCQVYEDVPHGARDERVAIVVTDEGVTRAMRK